MTRDRFSRAQLKIMRVLWEKKRLTARELTEYLNKRERIAHSTVQTVLRRLEQKGAVDHDTEDRTFYYYPLVREDNARGRAVRDVINGLFSGSPAGLVAFLIQNEDIDPEKLAEMHELIDRREREEKND